MRLVERAAFKSRLPRCVLYLYVATLLDKGFKKADDITNQIKGEFINNPNWKTSEKELRNLRIGAYYALLGEEDDIDKAAAIVEDLFNQLFKAYNF